MLEAARSCLVCEWTGTVHEAGDTPSIGWPCPDCRAPTERTSIVRMRPRMPNLHAAALGKLGGLKGGPARAAALSAGRRREIARAAALARWSR